MLPLFYSEHKSITSLPLTDRAIHYGDGIFETIAIKNNQPQLLEQHLIRLSRGCNDLQLPKIDLEKLKEEINFVLTKHPQAKAILKIILTRGDAERGYSPGKNLNPRQIIALYPWPEGYLNFTEIGVNVFLCKTKLAYNPILSGIKHLNRLEQIVGRLEFSSEQYQEGLMFTENNTVVEGTMSNVFIFKNNTLLTPQLDNCGIPGIMRNEILQKAAQLNINWEITQIDLPLLLSADEIFLCNSIIKIWPVAAIMEQKFLIGEKTKQLIKALW